MSVEDEGYLRFYYSQFYCEVLRLTTKGHGKFSVETRRLACKNYCKNREIERWHAQKQEDLDSHQLHGMSKIAAETWLSYLNVNDEWRDQETDLRRTKKKTLSETTEEDVAELYIDDDEADDDAMDVDADIPADDADDQEVIDTLDDQMMDGKKGEKKSDIPDSLSAPSTGEKPKSSEAAKKEKEAGSRTWASRARSRTPTRTVQESRPILETYSPFAFSRSTPCVLFLRRSGDEMF